MNLGLKVAIAFLSVFATFENAHACYLESAQESSRSVAADNCENVYNGTWTQKLQHYGGGYAVLTASCYVPGGGTSPYSYPTICPTTPPPPPTEPDPGPGGPNHCPKKGSIINVLSRTVEERVSVAGTGMFLRYASDRVHGYKNNRTRFTQTYGDCFSGPLMPPCPVRSFTFSVAGVTTAYNRGTDAVEGLNFIWSGEDGSGNRFIGSQQLSLAVADIPEFPNEIPMEYSEPIGSYMPIHLGLGGWTLSDVHFYDSVRKTVFRGDGSAFKSIPISNANPNIQIASEDGSEIYVFDSTGRHIQTKSTIKGTVLLTIAYSNGRITTVTDAFTNQTTVLRDGNGNPTSIVGPYGHTTLLTTNSDGYLTSITNPSSEAHVATYLTGDAEGLLSTFQTPKGVTAGFEYTSSGLLTLDSSTAGSSTSLSAFTSNAVLATSAMGITDQYDFSRTPPNTELFTVRGNYQPYSKRFEYTKTPEGLNSSTKYTSGADRVTFANYGFDPRLPSVGYPNYGTDGTASNYRTITGSRSATLSDPDNVFSVLDLNQTTVLNSTKTTSVSYLASTSKFTKTSPVGRKTYVTVDTYERPTSVQYATYTPKTISYDTRGRVSTVAQGANRTKTFAYDVAGNLQSITNPLSQIKSFTYDSSGRILTETLPDNRVVTYTYDANGNLTSVTPPSGPAHTMLHNGFDLLSKYTAPAISFLGLEKSVSKAKRKTLNTFSTFVKWIAGFFEKAFPVATKKLTAFTVNRNTDYEYNLDRQLISIARPSGELVEFNYSTSDGKLNSVVVPNGTYTITHDYFLDRISSTVSPDGVTQTFSYDGPFVLSSTNSGATSGTVYFTYNAELYVGTTKVNTAAAVPYTYDNDGLLTVAGNQSITRNAGTGFATKATLSSASENYTYTSTFGELASIQGKYSTSTNVYLANYTRDHLGRVTQKVETAGATSANTFVYSFDVAGRLTGVTKNGAALSQYVYDSNSNRTSQTISGITTLATYDEQDRLATWGTRTYSYNYSGERTSVTDSSVSPAAVTSYTYDVFGNIKSVTLPSSTVIEYLLDGKNRRVGRKVSGSLQKQFVWFDQLRPAAELDAAGNIVSQFVYGLKGNVPDYIIKGSVRYKVMTDHLGSVVAVVHSTNGTVAQRLEYDEFGKILSDTSPGFQPFGFAGGLYDPDTKLSLFGARSYDPEVGRWLSKDPILFAGGDTNLYGYVMSDPVNFIDPMGTDSWFVTTIGGKNDLPGHTYFVVDDPVNIGKFRVFDLFPKGGLSTPIGQGTAREQTLSALQVANLGLILTGWKKQSSGDDMNAIIRAQGLSNLINNGEIKYDPTNITGLNCIGFGAAAR